jgi:hypothetical protein
MYGECDYCHKFKTISARTKFCRQCWEQWHMVMDKFLDGDPLTPLEAAAYLIGERQEGK